jgi:CubicO group peptidase (beta-lactamase class C family)
MLPPDALRLVDDVFARFAAGPDGPPGIAWGVVAGGALAHIGSAGTLVVGEERPPDATSVFRIASMTKSFTAATILLLRDEGRLALDDPVARHVPEVAALRGPTADSPELTIRHLLTMSAGFPTDDPLGDRLQGMPLDAFGDLLRGGITFAWPPGTMFEYSNLGYGILGRVVTSVAGREYREVVEDRLLRPLTMTDTTYLVDDVVSDRLAHGYVRRDEHWTEETIDGYGALAAMGGIFTSVRDLARWTAGFVDAFPARDDPEDGHPLTRASRREMQQVHRAIEPELTFDGSGVPPTLAAGGYGLGLFVSHELGLGTVVGHGGGYPGFGSHMRWHPATGLGVLALANARYAGVHGPTAEALRALVRSGAVAPRRVVPANATARLREAADRLIATWDDDLADAVFAPNMDLDEPRERRRAQLAAVAERVSPAVPDGDDPPTSDSPSHVRWWLRGERGRLRVGLLASAEVPPRIQALQVLAVPDPTPALAAVAERVVALLADEAPRWPADLATAADVDVGALERGLRAARLLLGSATLGRPVGGDGDRLLTAEVGGERGRGELRLELDASGAVLRALVVPDPLTVPPGGV